MRYRLFFLTLVTIFSAACTTGSSDKDDNDGADPTIPEELGFEESKELTQLRVAMKKPTEYLPGSIALTDQEAVIVSDLMYDGLTQTDSANKLVPALALEWESQQNFTVWDFTLDSERITANEVLASFQALKKSELGSVNSVLSTVVSLEVLENSNVRFVLNSPNAGFPWLLSGVNFAVVGEDEAATSLYSVASSTKDTMELQSRQPGGLDIKLKWVDSGEAAYSQMLVGSVDGGVIASEQVGKAEREFGFDFLSLAVSEYIVVNSDSSFADSEVSADELFISFSNDIAQTSSARRLVSMAAHSVVGSQTISCQKGCAYDTDNKMQDADALQVKVDYSTDEQKQFLEAIGEQLKVSNIATELRQPSAEELAVAIERGENDLFMFGWSSPAVSADGFVPFLFGQESAIDLAGGLSQESRDLLLQARVEQDDKKRWQLLSDVEQLVLKESLIKPVVAHKSRLLLSDEASSTLSVEADGSILLP